MHEAFQKLVVPIIPKFVIQTMKLFTFLSNLILVITILVFCMY